MHHLYRRLDLQAQIYRARPTVIKDQRSTVCTIMLTSCHCRIKSDHALCRKLLPDSQTAYRKLHSTSDNVWAIKYYAAACQHFDMTYDVLALDMSKAFDSMLRENLMEVMSWEDELRMIGKDLQNTTLTVRVGKIASEKLNTTMETPQGDALSPTLFTVFLEKTLRTLRSQLPAELEEQVFECTYSDDVNFVESKRDVDEAAKIAPTTLKELNLIMNETKTER